MPRRPSPRVTLLLSLFPALLMTPTKATAAAPVQLPPYEEHRLDNGLRVLIAPKRDLPLAAVDLVVETGGSEDPKGKAGLASFTAGLLRRGTTTRSADEIDGSIEFVGGALDTGAGRDASSVSASATSENLPLALELVADVGLHPSFPKAEFELHKRRVTAFLAQALDDPGTVADRAMLGAILLPDHPYAMPSSGTRSSIKAIRLADVRAFHAKHYAPERATLIVVGDVEPAKVLSLARKHFGAWKTKAPQRPAIAEAAPLKKNRILIIHKEKATQVQVRFVGAAFTRKTDPAFFPMVVANGAFGGGFTSRLVDEIRVNRGLSYSVGTRLLQLREAGFYTFSSFTKNETIGELLQVAIGEAGRARQAGFSGEELSRSKSYLSGVYPLRLETNEQIASALMEMQLYDLPKDWVLSYRRRLAEATPEQIDDAAKAWFFARPFAIVLVGDKKAIRKGLAQAGVEGDVQVIPIEELE
ncbi:M16 family metallopeptidase [Vulgatibacter incomptus]|uniref:Putative secreted zinc protease n=1 Tax=Vulgatibacter incomptus TaxID=1391653 RepID=A0A0K1PCS0_9BACT|nr:pitrilysin family protein [Vulgatibacter incomptus]AKU91297.1 putative secreted zinc protease [Vulgatibacter incomptus]